MSIISAFVVFIALTFFLLVDIVNKDERFWAFVIFFQHIPLIIFDQLGIEIIGMIYFAMMVILYFLKSPKLILSKSRLSNPITLSIILLLFSLTIHYFFIGIDPDNSRGFETLHRVLIFNLPIILLCLFSVSGNNKFLSKLMEGIIVYGLFFLVTVFFVSGLAEIGVAERGEFREDFRISPLAAAKTAGIIIIAIFIKILNEDKLKPKLTSLLVGALALSLIFISGSRAALIFLILVMVLYFIFSKYKFSKKLLIISSFLIIATIAYAVVIQLNLPILERFQALQRYDHTLLRYRRLVYSFELFKNFEMGLFGLGPFGFGFLTGLNYPHNLIAEFIVDYGLLGAGSMLLLIVPGFYYSFQLIKSKYQMPSFIALIFIYLFLTSLTSGDIVSARHLQFTAILVMNYVLIQRNGNYYNIN